MDLLLDDEKIDFIEALKMPGQNQKVEVSYDYRLHDR